MNSGYAFAAVVALRAVPGAGPAWRKPCALPARGARLRWPGLLPALWLALHAGVLAASPQAVDDPAALGDLSIEQLMDQRIEKVYSASKYEQKVTHAPASVTVVGADEIKKFGYRSLADILSAVAGLYVTNDRNYSFLGFRGFSQPGDFNTGVLLLIDGHRVNDSLYNLMYVAHEALIDVDMIERVEVIRGPGSSIYGNSAFFGVIDIVTRRGEQIGGEEVSASAGSFDTRTARLASGRKLDNGVEYTASGSFYSSQGQRRLFYPEFNTPPDNNGVAVDADDETAAHWFGSVAYGDVVLSSAFSHRYKNVPTGPDGTLFNSGQTHTSDERGYVDLKFEHQYADQLGLMARASYDWYPYRAQFAYANDTPPPDVILNQDRAFSQWVRSEVQLTKHLWERDTVVFGAEYQQNLLQRQQNFDPDPPNVYVDIDHRSRNYAVYAQGEFEPWRRLLVNAGVRYDHHYSFGGTVNPRLGLIYSPLDKTTFKAIYGEAFRAPNDYELNFQSSDFVRNPDLEPEAIRTYELVYEQYLPASLRFSASVYHNDIKGLIAQVTDPATGVNQFRNLERVHANGLELQIEGRYTNGLLTRVSYANQKTADADSGMELSNSPAHLVKFNLSVPMFDQALFSSAELQYRSASITPARQHAGGFVLVNWTLYSSQLAPGLTLAGSLYNLLDRVYATPAGGAKLQETLQQDGRSLRLKATYAFGGGGRNP